MPPRLSLATIPSEDPKVYDLICAADTVGVFQIESRGQMSMLPRLKPRCFYDLVIEVAIVRPGPIVGKMVHPYLRRRNGKEPVVYPDEKIAQVLGRTLGVPLFQEQAMALAIVAAGFTPGEAEKLRRTISAWKSRGKDAIPRYHRRFMEGMIGNGYDLAFAEQCFERLKGFSEYGFPESHSASFALLVYASAWIKCYHPAAFAAALINSQPMGFYAPAQLVQDARRHGVAVRPVEVAVSRWDCSLEAAAGSAPALRLGLRLVRGLPAAAAGRLVAARDAAPFTSIDDLAARARLDAHELGALAAAGALAGLAGHRHQAAWQVLGVEPPLPLLGPAGIAEGIPMLRSPTEGEDIVADYRHLGLTLGRHPLALLRGKLRRAAVRSAADIQELAPGSLVQAAGLVITRQRPGTASGVVFVTLEDETGQVNLIVWQAVAERQRRTLLQARLMGAWGTVQREGDVLHLIAGRLVDYSGWLGTLAARSRDFH